MRRTRYDIYCFPGTARRRRVKTGLALDAGLGNRIQVACEEGHGLRS